MTLVQLEYAVAVATYQSFSIAAQKCFVTQPTLSMQIQKLEEEFGTILFDRQHKPVVLTESGLHFIEQARVILNETKRLREMLVEIKGEISGTVTLGILPTIAPYLLPLFLETFQKECPSIRLIINELTTDEIVSELDRDTLDAGILATPIERNGFNESILYLERLFLYVSPHHPLSSQSEVELSDIHPADLWLLRKGHCFREQALKICDVNTELGQKEQISFESGSIETIIKILDRQSGVTIIPQLATLYLADEQLNCIRTIAQRDYSRQISLITKRSMVKSKAIELLINIIKASLPSYLSKNANQILRAS